MTHRLGGFLPALTLLLGLASVDASDLDFTPDPGIRVDYGAIPSAGVDTSGAVYLYYHDTAVMPDREMVSVAADGLTFPPGTQPTTFANDPRRILLPSGTWRRYSYDPQAKVLKSSSGTDGLSFTDDAGIRYVPQPADNATFGVYDTFVDDAGGATLLYIGDMLGLNNVRRAYSPPSDNGLTFVFDRGDVLGDSGSGGGPNSYVDERSLLLPGGGRRLFVMRQGTIHSFLSGDEGVTFSQDAGVRLAPSSFTGITVTTLHDPTCVLLADGRYRLYVAGDVPQGTGSKSVILSGTTAQPTPRDSFLAGAGLGQPNPNRVRIFTASGAATPVDFLAYAAGHWGTNVVAGELDGGAYEEIVTGPGPGDVLGPQVRAFARDGTAIAKVNFFAYGTLKRGVNVATGALDGDPFSEILSGAGPGVVFGPHVRGWNHDGATLSAIAKLSFFAYGTLSYGANVATGGLDGDAYEEILTGPGPGIVFRPQVRGWNFDAAATSSIAAINFDAFTTLQYGVNVSAGDVDGDGFGEIVCAPGPGAGPSFPARLRGFDYDGSLLATLRGCDVTPWTTTYGGRAGTGELNGDVTDELTAGAGRDPSAPSTVAAFRYAPDTASLVKLPASFDAFAGTAHGASVVGGHFGY